MKKQKSILIIVLITIAVVIFLGIGAINKIKNTQTTGGSVEEIECLPKQRNVDGCIEIYQPVCATVNIQCITTPCNPIKETFENSCKACTNSLVSSYINGEC
ncbi:hypothetical protein CL621_03580 [archaeon]|nr:hypothetical protein [archaeon]|tara:strand:+ start:1105 stop:1410 length:306 start_codon:yes stop_codon:yes gene_type:complete